MFSRGRRMFRRRVLTVALCVTLCTAGPASAWFESGHHLIALLAFELLSQTEKEELLSVLAHHPRFVQDFAPPEGIRDVDRFRVGTAGYWPDIARQQLKYDRPNWHYQLGATLTLGDPASLKVPETPGPLPAGASLETQKLHIAQAVELCRRLFKDQNTPAPDRAIALCWLAHLVGDAHQPCHAGSLYAEGLFPEGDRGGNLIPTQQNDNLHALWDGMLGEAFDEDATKRRVEALRAHSDFTAIGTEAVSRANGLDPLTWLSESRQASVKYTYTREVLVPIEAVAKQGGELPVLYLSERYLLKAENLAQLRAVEAGHRLAKVWKEGLSNQRDASPACKGVTGLPQAGSGRLRGPCFLASIGRMDRMWDRGVSGSHVGACRRVKRVSLATCPPTR
jgi:hypothetical protein